MCMRVLSVSVLDASISQACPAGPHLQLLRKQWEGQEGQGLWLG